MNKNNPIGAKPRVAILTLAVIASASSLVASSPFFFGPKPYALATGEPQTFSEPIVVDEAARCSGKAAFVLVFRNGDGSGHGVVASGKILLNGLPLLVESDFQRVEPLIEVPVLLSASNVLTVELKGGKPGNSVTLSIRREIEERLERQTFRLTDRKLSADFSLAVSDPSGVFTLVASNGDEMGNHRIQNGSVAINGQTILPAVDLRGSRLVRRRIALNASNSIHVELQGEAGGIAAIEITRLLDESACGPRVFFSSPSEGETVTTPRILVTGTATGSSDLGITVNGSIAEIDLNHAGTPADPFRWFAEVEASRGVATLKAVAMDAARASSEATRAITFFPDAGAVELRMSPANGPAPLKVALSAATSDPGAISRYEIDFESDGIYDYTSASLPEEVAHTYLTSGIHTATIRATAANGSLTITRASVAAQAFAVMDALLRRNWTGFTTALSSADLDRALAFLADDATRNKYRRALALIKPTISQFAAGLADVRPVWIYGNAAHYLLIRNESGRLHGYHIYFVRDRDGVWRISQF